MQRLGDKRYVVWGEHHYQTFFAVAMKWPPTVTIDQPMGVLDATVDAIKTAEENRGSN